MDANTPNSLPPINPAIINELVFVLQIWQIFKYLYVSAFTWMIFDWILTLKQELRYMWVRKQGFTSLVFFINRYYHISAFSVGLWMLVPLDIGPEMCSIVQRFCTIGLGFTPVMIPNVLLAMRVYAMYERRRFLGVFLALFLVGYSGANIHSMASIIRVPSSGAIFLPQLGCSATLRNTFSTTTPLIIQNVFDVTIICLTLFRGLQGYRLKGGLIETLIKDGILYFIPIFTINFAWMVMTFTTAPEIKPLLAVPSIIVMITLSSRITLNLRAKALFGTGPSIGNQISIGSIQFASVGNSKVLGHVWSGAQ